MPGPEMVHLVEKVKWRLKINSSPMLVVLARSENTRRFKDPLTAGPKTTYLSPCTIASSRDAHLKTWFHLIEACNVCARFPTRLSITSIILLLSALQHCAENPPLQRSTPTRRSESEWKTSHWNLTHASAAEHLSRSRQRASSIYKAAAVNDSHPSPADQLSLLSRPSASATLLPQPLTASMPCHH